VKLSEVKTLYASGCKAGHFQHVIFAREKKYTKARLNSTFQREKNIKGTFFSVTFASAFAKLKEL
jgi:hypothetical protein